MKFRQRGILKYLIWLPKGTVLDFIIFTTFILFYFYISIVFYISFFIIIVIISF